MAGSNGAAWAYVHGWRMLFAFLGVALVILGIGFLLVLGAGPEGAFGASILLALAVFLVLFAVLLFVPRIVRRGAQTYRLVAERPPEEVEEMVRTVIEERGYRVLVEAVPSRSGHPTKIVSVDGQPVRFVLTPIVRRLRRKEPPGATDVLQIGVTGESDPAAKDLRDLVTSRLVPPPEGSG